MDWNPLNWPADISKRFFQSAGGDLAAGINTGLTSFAVNLWEMIRGPFYIAFGAWLLLIGLVFLFSEELLKVSFQLALAAIPK